MSGNLAILSKIIREWYLFEFEVTDEKKMLEHMGMACNGCRESFDLAGAKVWGNLLQAFALRNSTGRDLERGDAIAFHILMFGTDFHAIQTDMRASCFWKEIMPTIIEQRIHYKEFMSKYLPDGEYGKNPPLAKMMMEVSEKNVRVLKSIFDNIDITVELGLDCVYRDMKHLLEDDCPDYEKAIMGFIHLYYLINRYGIILRDGDLEELKKDAEEWMLEICLGDQSLRFIKELSEKMTDG